MDDRNISLMAAFDMLNDRLYNIEETNQRLLRHKKEKLIKSQYLPSYIFDYPFDVVLDNTTDTKFQEKRECILYFEGIGDVYPIVDKRKDEIKDSLSEWFTEEEQHVIYHALYEGLNYGDIVECDQMNINTHHKHITDYILERYIQKQFTNLCYIVSDGFDGYYFVFEDLNDVDTTITLGKTLLRYLEKDETKAKYLRIVANMKPCYTRLWIWCVADRHDTSVKKMISKVNKTEIRNFVDCILREMITRPDRIKSKMLKDAYSHKCMLPVLRTMISTLEDMCR
jgi:hypothetical protein